MPINSKDVEVGIRADADNFKPRAKDYDKTFTSVTIRLYEHGVYVEHELTQTAARHLSRGLAHMAKVAGECS